MTEQSDVDISSLNSFALPCIARKVICFNSISDVESFFKGNSLSNDEYLILGGGSNILLPARLDKTVLRFMFDAVAYTELGSEEVLVEVEAGKRWDELVAETVDKGYVGLENLSLIPGSTGAAPVQNIGAYGVELSDVLESVSVYDTDKGAVCTLDNKQCQFAYRDSIFKRQPGRYLVLSLRLRLSSRSCFNLGYGELRVLQSLGDGLRVSQVREKVIEVRMAKLPNPDEIPNVGSFFKNPIVSNERLSELRRCFSELISYDLGNGYAKLAAGWLIDQAGWKGKSVGAVGVHTKQALVLINLGDATQNDVVALARDIQASILSMFSVQLEIEPIVISS